MTSRWVALGLAVALVAAGCGDDDGDGAATTSAAPATSGPAATDSPPDASTTTTEVECSDEALSGGTVSTVGFDEITFGMTVTAAEEASGACLRADRPVNQDCYHVVPVPGPEGISFLVTDGTIERLDVTGTTITTRSGIGVGSTEAELREQFGASLETRARADGAGNELILVPADEGDADFRVVFETDGQSVTGYRSGRLPQVDTPVPCPGGGEVSVDDSLDDDEQPVSSG